MWHAWWFVKLTGLISNRDVKLTGQLFDSTVKLKALIGVSFFGI